MQWLRTFPHVAALLQALDATALANERSAAFRAHAHTALHRALDIDGAVAIGRVPVTIAIAIAIAIAIRATPVG